MWREEILPLFLGLMAAAGAMAWIAQDPWPREQVPVISARPPAPDACAGSACWQPVRSAGLE
jgi:hypothetical protein